MCSVWNCGKTCICPTHAMNPQCCAQSTGSDSTFNLGSLTEFDRRCIKGKVTLNCDPIYLPIFFVDLWTYCIRTEIIFTTLLRWIYMQLCKVIFLNTAGSLHELSWAEVISQNLQFLLCQLLLKGVPALNTCGIQTSTFIPQHEWC